MHNTCLRLLGIWLSVIWLSSCTTTHSVSYQYRFKPNSKNKGFAALSITCQGIASGTRNLLFVQEARTSVLGKMLNADTVSAITFSCNPNNPYYTLQILPTGTYYLTGIVLGTTRALFHFTFEVMKNEITYVGRLHIIATQPLTMKTVTFNTVNPGVMQFELQDQIAIDKMYFKNAYPYIGMTSWNTH